MGLREIRQLTVNAGGFDWNRGNIDKNLIKHHVTSQESEEIFFNEPKVFFEDKKHFLIEKRYQILGVTNQRRKLSIIFTLRRNKIRVISARNQNKKERRKYEKEA